MLEEGNASEVAEPPVCVAKEDKKQMARTRSRPRLRTGTLAMWKRSATSGTQLGTRTMRQETKQVTALGGESGVGKSILEPKSWEAKRRSSPEGKRVHDIESWGLA